MTALSGVWTASLTPLKADLSADTARLARHIEWLLECGSHGVVILGTTGEGPSFSADERIAIMDDLAEAGCPIDRLLVGTGASALPDAERMTKHAVALGYRGVLLLPPFYFKSVSDDGVYAFLQRLIDGVGSSALEIVLYHFPAMAGVGYSLELISRLLAFYPEQVVGIKDSGGDPDALRAFCTEFPGFATFAGTERLLPDCLASGGVGCISATANVTSRLVRSVYDGLVGGANESGDEARSGSFRGDDTKEDDVNQLVDRMLAVRRALEQGPLAAVLKHVMATRTGDKEWLHLRPPLVPPAAASMDSFSVENIERQLASVETLPNFVS